MNAPMSSLATVEEDEEPIPLTPFLSLAVALLYMLMADGEIDDHESSQLQAVIGGNQDVLELAFEYVETIELDQFLKDAPPILSNEDKLCILCNLCDCLLADGVCQPVEEDLFQKICASFGYSTKSFSTYYSAISLKNEKSLLGPYDATLLDEEAITPHLAMAASLLYMMAADGDIAQEEMGQLQVVIGEFEHLQPYAMQYVRKVKMNQFCSQASSLLNADQKLLILANVCDSMMSDGKVVEIEKRLFENMLAAFDVSEKQFSSYYAPLEIKNFKPFGSDEEIKSLHTRKRTRRKGAGKSFGMSLTHKHSNANGKREINDAANQGEWEGQESQGSLSDIVTRTMQENIQQVTETFEDAKDVERVAINATEKLKQDDIAQAGSDANLQKIKDAAGLANVQKIGANGFQINRQGAGEGGYADNRQGADFAAYMSAPPNLVSDIRLDGLQKNIDQVHDKLDRINPKRHEKTAITPLPVEPAPAPNKVAIEESQINNTVKLENSWPELNFQTVVVPKVDRPLRKIPIAIDPNSKASVEFPNETLTEGLTDVGTEVDSVVALQIASKETSQETSEVEVTSIEKMSAPHEVSPLAPELKPVHDAGLPKSLGVSVKLSRSLKFVGLATACVVLPMGVYGYGALYPTLSCQGQAQQSRLWTAEADGTSSVVAQENQVAETHRIEIRRGEVYLDNHRFPLYKELNRDNHFAAQTPLGFHGSYTTHAVENMSYAFEFNTANQSLNIYTQSSGIRFIEGEVGQMKVSAVFTGQCEKPWF